MEDLLAKVQLKYPNFDIMRRNLNRVVNDNNINYFMQFHINILQIQLKIILV
jgi:hypothetical protein